MKTLDKWYDVLKVYPKWTLGGSNIELNKEGYKGMHPIYVLGVDGEEELLDAYISLIEQEGFIMHEPGRYYKDIEGTCYFVDCADGYYEGSIKILFYVDKIKKKFGLF